VSLMQPASSLGGAYYVPPSITADTLTHLRRYRATEAVCFWLGRSGAPDAASVSELWIPEFTATPVSYDIHPLQMLRLKAHLDEAHLSVLVQVHSHPGAAFHSSRDDRNAASPWPGFISIVIPDHGHICNGFWECAEVYELLGGAKWKHLSSKEKLERFYGHR
jgi:proteasome lid subunit RPN8/RPN11